MKRSCADIFSVQRPTELGEQSATVAERQEWVDLLKCFPLASTDF